MALTETDRHFLERALALAERGRGMTSPNPVVGAVVVVDGRIAGEGFHAAAGQDHAEIVAMKASVGDDISGLLVGATIYVTLEPCCHQGRTPPCTDALIAAGVTRVVVGAEDPSEWVHGRGIRLLRAAGIVVDVADGDLAYKSKRQNDPFRKHVTAGLPFVTYKYAMTIDGRVATESGDSKWISCEESRLRVHDFRARSDAVLVGAGTFRNDDPQLTARDVPVHRQPLRVVVDSHLGAARESALVRTALEGTVLFVCTESVPESRIDEVRSWGVEVEILPATPNGHPEARSVGRLLGERHIQSVFLEGGATLAAVWWDAGLIDRIIAFVAPVVAGGASSPGPLPATGYAHMDAALRLRDVTVEQSGSDVMVSGYVGQPA